MGEFLRGTGDIIRALAALVGAIVSLITLLNGVAGIRQHKANKAKRMKLIAVIAIGALGIVLISGAIVYGGVSSVKKLETEKEELVGEYQWQWAGQNWIGYVGIYQQDGNLVAKLREIKKIFKEGDSYRVIKIVEGSEGSVKLYGNGVKLTLPVTWRILDKNDQPIKTKGNPPQDSTIEETLVARLSPIKAYCGTVEYVIDKKVKGVGDMTLIKDVSFHP